MGDSYNPLLDPANLGDLGPAYTPGPGLQNDPLLGTGGTYTAPTQYVTPASGGSGLGPATGFGGGTAASPYPYESGGPSEGIYNVAGNSDDESGTGNPFTTGDITSGPPTDPLTGAPVSSGSSDYDTGAGLPPGAPGAAATAANSGSALGWVGELALRAMLVLVGTALVLGGFYIAGQRAVAAGSPAGAARGIFLR
jgi:hypothetical protein